MKKTNIFLMAIWVLVLAVGAQGDTISHETWDKLLQTHVNAGRVDYLGFKKDVVLLDRYLASLATVPITDFSREEQLAFWINAYNAFTIKLIIDNLPLKSINNIPKPWDQKTWRAAGQTLSLNQMEHQKLRDQLKEPRIHFAVVCASIGCPDLRPQAFKANKIEEQLDKAARQFFKNPRHFSLQKKGDQTLIQLSQIFNWFSTDFGSTPKECLRFIALYLDKELARKITQTRNLQIHFLPYDWNLNTR